MCKFLTLLIACFCVLQLNAKSSKKEPEVDFSILEQTSELSSYLTATQRIELIRIEEAIRSGEEKIRSGEYMQARKPSALNPNEDIKATHERGEEMVEEGEQIILDNKIKLVGLLETAQQQRTDQEKVLAERYKFSLEAADYETALKQAAQAVLNAAWADKYDNILYDGVRTVNKGVSSDSSADIRNQTYDILIALDGTRFTVNMPIDLKLVSAEDSQPHFSYGNESAFKDAKTALFAIEQIILNDAGESIIAVRAFDLASFELIEGQVLALKTEDSAEADGPSARPTGGKINDQQNLLSTLANLETPYQFGWDLSSVSDPDLALAYSMLLQDTIVQQNSGVRMLETAYVERTYLDDLDADLLAQKPSAVFQLQPTESAEAAGESFTLSARLTSNDREIIIGTASFDTATAN